MVCVRAVPHHGCVLGLKGISARGRGPGAVGGTRRMADAFREKESRCRTTCVFCKEQAARTGWGEDEMGPSCLGEDKLGGG